ncbi:GntR family transcriptional regulator [Arthrobacter sp. FX8]|uniref:GntR family transcriptional regulator n=1 Tax=Arthrobacter sp. FX8 TaxID=2997335 RepID=UPI00227D3CBA|nr:GntR family transcriptional regulator [Arthrobacter sp. FX8]WAJ33007.1 GntR family transcriptional regulator [Arthrobacter sp. FX8]
METPDGLLLGREDMSLRKRAENVLRDAIIYGSFEPGQKLVERDLCAKLGVSRTLLREALQQLQAEGLITNVVHKGISVAVITEEDAREIYEARQLIEGHVAHGFTMRATEDEITALSAAVQALRAAGADSSPAEVLQAKNVFYEVLLANCGNKVLAQMHHQLNNRVTILRRRTLSTPGRFEQTVNELEEIVDAIRRRDADEACRLCRAHVERAGKIALDSFASGPASTAGTDVLANQTA